MPVYEDAIKDFPDRNIPLETKDGTWYFFSSDPLRQEITYSSAPGKPANLRTLFPEQAQEVIAMNRRGERPYTLGGKETSAEAVENVPDYENVVGQDDLTRFDKKNSERRNNRNNNRSNRNNYNNRPRNNRSDNHA